jgi:hypothetical protein
MSVRVMSWVFDHSGVQHRGDLLVLLVLADHAHEDGSSAYPSVGTIARKARLSRRGVFGALARLKEAGAIAAEGRGPKGTTSYRVVMTGVQSLQGCTDCTGALSSTGGCSHRTRGVQSPAPEPSFNHPQNHHHHEPSLTSGDGVAEVEDRWAA